MSVTQNEVATPESNEQTLEVLVKKLKGLGHKLSEESLIATLIAHLSGDVNFIMLVRNLAREGVAEYIAQSTRDDGEIPTISDNDNITGYTATVHKQRNENTLLRVGIHSPHHPRHPNALDIFIRRDGDEDKWENVHLSESAEAVIRSELNRHAPEVGEYYWVELIMLSRTPINESSREIPLAPVTDEASGDLIDRDSHVICDSSSDNTP